MSYIPSKALEQLDKILKTCADNIGTILNAKVTIELSVNRQPEAKEVLNDKIVSLVFEHVCAYYDVKTEDIKVYNRKRELAEARQLIAVLLQKYTHKSDHEIAGIINRDRSCLNGYKSNVESFLYIKDIKTTECYNSIIPKIEALYANNKI